MIATAAIIFLSAWMTKANIIGRPRDCHDIISEGSIYGGHYVVYPNTLNPNEATLIYCSQEDGMEALPSEMAPRNVNTNCLDLLQNGMQNSGPSVIYPDPGHPTEPVLVFCDQQTDGGGWAVIQHRFDGSENFYRSWDDYAKGFGNVALEHYLGNDNIAAITSQSVNELRVDLEDWSSVKRFAHYQFFLVKTASYNYKLDVGLYNGNAGDSIDHHDGQSFSTYNADHDGNSYNCASKFHGAWWYSPGDNQSCLHSNLNGRYYSSPTTTHWDGMIWKTFHDGSAQPLKTAQMMVRPYYPSVGNTGGLHNTLDVGSD